MALTTADTPTLQAARRAWSQQRFDVALHLFDEAVRSDKQNLRALVDAARAHGFRYDYRRAEQLADRLIQLAGHRPDAWLWAGETFRMIALPDRAAACFERSCELGATPQALWELAVLYERRHRLDEAAALVDRVLALERKHGPCLLVKARIERRAGRIDAAEATLRDLIALPPLRDDVLAQAWGELASLCDEQGRYDEAWDAMLRSKEITQAHAMPERKASDFVVARFRRMVDSITSDDFRRWNGSRATVEPLPDGCRGVALLTGFPRSGTTLLEQVLDSHPELVSSEERDVFSREVFPALATGVPLDVTVQEMLHRVPPGRINEQRRVYFRYMQAMLPAAIGSRVHLDKNPAMNLMIPAMLRVFPELRLIVALRDPRDVVLSCYLRYLPLNPVSVAFLTIAGTAERYCLDLQAWLKMRSMIAAPWTEIRYEDTVADLPAQARKALALLNLPWNDAVLSYRDRAATKQVLSPTYDAVTKPLYTSAIGRWRHYERHLAPVLPVLAPLVRELGYVA